MINELIYVYCISNTAPEPGHNIGAEGLKYLKFNGFYAIVKYVSKSEFSEEDLKRNILDIQWLETNAREHMRVISLIMEYSTVIPFKFGTIYNTKAGLKKFITDYSGSLTENFHHLQGKEEWAVKIYCDRKALSFRIDELSEEAAELEEQIMASSPGKAFILGRKKTDLIEMEINRLCKKYGQTYYDELRNLSEATNLNHLLPKELSGKQHEMILNSTFLVRKDKVDDFKSTVNALKERDGKSGFYIDATGPWPPFSFISIKEKQ